MLAGRWRVRANALVGPPGGTRRWPSKDDQRPVAARRWPPSASSSAGSNGAREGSVIEGQGRPSGFAYYLEAEPEHGQEQEQE